MCSSLEKNKYQKRQEKNPTEQQGSFLVYNILDAAAGADVQKTGSS